MKKVNLLLAGIAFLGFVSCGSSTSEQEAVVAAEETVAEEVVAEEATEDTAMMAEADTMATDSAMVEEEVAE